MFARTKHRTVHFDQPFWMPDLGEIVSPGDYQVDEDEELIEGIRGSPIAVWRPLSRYQPRPRTNTESV